MQLIDFCAQAKELMAKKPSVLLFSSKTYAPLSFAKILQWLSTSVVTQQGLNNSFPSSSTSIEDPVIEKISFTKLDLDSDLDQLKMKLHTTFLGQTCTFWFGDLSLISAKKKRADWLIFLQNYQGPHQIIGWLSAEDECTIAASQGLMITVPELYNSELVSKLSFLYQGHKPEIVAYFFGRLYRHQKEFSLEQLCLLSNYAGLIGKNMDSFFDQWLAHLIISDVSL